MPNASTISQPISKRGPIKQVRGRQGKQKEQGGGYGEGDGEEESVSL